MRAREVPLPPMRHLVAAFGKLCLCALQDICCLCRKTCWTCWTGQLKVCMQVINSMLTCVQLPLPFQKLRVCSILCFRSFRCHLCHIAGLQGCADLATASSLLPAPCYRTSMCNEVVVALQHMLHSMCSDTEREKSRVVEFTTLSSLESES